MPTRPNSVVLSGERVDLRETPIQKPVTELRWTALATAATGPFAMQLLPLCVGLR